ncbi:hypothetical protein JXL83_01940 [candidate division WOR-3 bacterium]|nr:hypothetical protein [candidate division WOR-3 bacterium]
MKYPRVFSLVLKLAGIVFLVFFLTSGVFDTTLAFKNRIFRTGALVFSVIAWRYFEELKKIENHFFPLIFFSFLFLGIFNAFFRVVKITPFSASVFLLLFVATALIKVLLTFKNVKYTKSDPVVYSVLGFFSFMSLAG